MDIPRWTADEALEAQLETLTRHVADLESAAPEVWAAVALPLAAAVNALNRAAGAEHAGFATEADAPVLLARQLTHALRRRKELAAAS